MREIAFRCRGVTLADTVKRYLLLNNIYAYIISIYSIADNIVHDAVNEVVTELEEFLDEYAEKLIEQI
jgi:uncharacterized protein YeeX (DUF496 family)